MMQRPFARFLHQVFLKKEKTMKIDLRQNESNLENHDPKESVFVQIESILTELRPYITSHGGDVTLVNVKEGVVFIKFSGACVSCPLSFYTVTYGIERHIKVKIPEIVRVEVIED